MSELHDELRVVARGVLAPVSPLVSGGVALTPDRARLAELGWLGIEVPEALGGSGATFAEMAVVLEELGRVAAAGPFLGAVLAVGALLLVEPSPDRDELLTDIATGSKTATVAFDVVDGEASFVIDAPTADVILLPTPEPAARSGTSAARSRGRFTVVGVDVVDPSRSFGHVRAGGSAVGTAGAWSIPVEPAAIERRAALAIAIDSIGIAGAVLDATVAYTSDRHQFGRPVGSFQAVKHACADVAVELAVSRRLVADAVADPTDASVSMAKAHATETATFAAGTALQLHGGIGYTWEHGLHVFFKRALLNQSLFGSPTAHRARLSRRWSDATRM